MIAAAKEPRKKRRMPQPSDTPHRLGTSEATPQIAIGTWLAWIGPSAAADSLPGRAALLATATLLVVHDLDVPAVTVASTLDASGSAEWHWAVASDWQSAEAIRAYLGCLRERRSPDSYLVETWDRFFRRYRPLVRRAIREHRVAASKRDDCAQEVWIAVVRALESPAYDVFQGRLHGWIRRIVRNRVINFLRAMSRPQIELDPDLERITCHREPDPASSYERHEDRQLVRQVFEHLHQEVSAVNYQIAHLRCIESWSFSEIAAEVNLTSAETRYRHYRTNKRLCELVRSHSRADE
jgi:RNA polymerase sigma factor (sigma-70 family)